MALFSLKSPSLAVLIIRTPKQAVVTSIGPSTVILLEEHLVLVQYTSIPLQLQDAILLSVNAGMRRHGFYSLHPLPARRRQKIIPPEYRLINGTRMPDTIYR